MQLDERRRAVVVAYAFKPHHTLARDVRAIVCRQIDRAEHELIAIGDARSDRALHDARRHLKKILALLRLVKPAIAQEYSRFSGPVRRACLMLAPLADAEALVGTASGQAASRHPGIDAASASAVRAALRRQQADADRKAAFRRVRTRAARLLALERSRVERWAAPLGGFESLAPGLARSMRRTRRAMARADSCRRQEAFHTWRRRVKDLWFQVRLVEGCCPHRLLPMRRRLERLDGLLGDYHNIVLLEAFLREGSCLAREDTARCLRNLRQRRTRLGHRALALGTVVLRDRPGAFVQWVASRWQAHPRAARGEAACRTA